MPRLPLFVGGSYESLSVRAESQRALNLFPERMEAGTGQLRFYGTPGLRKFRLLPTQPVRGLWASEYRLFVVSGSRLYELFEDGSFNDRGDVEDDGLPVLIFPNGGQLMIISNDKVWIDTGTEIIQPEYEDLTGIVDAEGDKATWVSGDEFALGMVGQTVTIDGLDHTITGVQGDRKALTFDPPLGEGATLDDVAYTIPGGPITARSGTFLDGYYIVSRPSSKEFALSSLYDGLNWDQLDVGVKQGYPDSINSLLSDHEELWIFGHETTEIWRNTGNADFPFERDMSAFIHYGNIARFSPVRLRNGVAWLGSDTRGGTLAFWAQGFQPIRISTHAIEQAWAKYATVEDAEGYAYLENGHEFWVLTFPTASKTWVYDATTQLWHERGGWDGATASRHRSRGHAFVWNKHFVGDFETGDLYEMSQAILDDAGTAITRLRTCPHLSDEQVEMFYHSLELDLDTGGAGNPAFTLELSNNGGRTYPYSMTEVATPPPDPEDDEIDARVLFWRLGQARDRVFRLSSTASIQHAWFDAYITVTRGIW